MVTAKKADKFKRKMWYSVVSPVLFNRKEIATTPALEPKDIIGRTIKTNAFVLLGNIKKQSISIKLQITGLKDNNAETMIKEYWIPHMHLSRVIRHGGRKIQVDEAVETKDKKKVAITMMVLTKGRSTETQNKEISKAVHDYIKQELPKLNYDSLILNALMAKIQTEIKINAKKIFPLKFVEINRIRLMAA